MVKAINDIYLPLIIDDIQRGLYKVDEEYNLWTKISKQGHYREHYPWRPWGVITKARGKRHTDYLELSYNGKKHILAHRLLFYYYHGYIDSDLTVNHFNGNGLDNTPTNLELATQTEQNEHRYRTLGYQASKGNKKIDEKIANEIRYDYLINKLTNKQCCEKYGICKASISYIVNGRTWTESFPVFAIENLGKRSVV